MGPALSGLSPRFALSFIVCRVGALFKDWMPFGIDFNAVWSLLFRFWLAKLYSTIWDRCVFVCVWEFSWRYSQHLRQTCKTRMIHTHSRRMFGDDLVPQLPAKEQIVDFRSFLDQNNTANRAQKPAIRMQKSTNGRTSGFLLWSVLTTYIWLVVWNIFYFPICWE